MNYDEMQEVLEMLNEVWGLDFVSATAGNCCNTCGEMMSWEDTERWENAETYLVIKWYFDGMNYDGELEELDTLHIKYNLKGKISIEEVCNDLARELEGYYDVEVPERTIDCIKLTRI